MAEVSGGVRGEHQLLLVTLFPDDMVMQYHCRHGIGQLEREYRMAVRIVGDDNDSFKVILKTFGRHRFVPFVETGQQVLPQLVRQADFQSVAGQRAGFEPATTYGSRIVGKGRGII